jgi:hypothetical protein
MGKDMVAAADAIEHLARERPGERGRCRGHGRPARAHRLRFLERGGALMDTPLNYESLTMASAQFLDRASTAEEQDARDAWRLASDIASRFASFRLAVAMVAAQSLNPDYAAIFRDLQEALADAEKREGC